MARHGRLRSPRPAVAALKFLAAALAVILVSTGGVAAFAVWNVTSAIGEGVALPGEDQAPPRIGTIEGGANLLLVGSDSGGGNAAYGERGEVLNDVTMLLHIAEDQQSATVVSFPRDLIVDIPECPDPTGGEVFPPLDGVKINNALQRGGLACPVETVKALTGLDIPYAAVIEFDGVVAMSNAVGGVPVCVATPIDDRQISFKLPAGESVLSGRDALQFLRSRYGVGDGSDLTRISNQQQFLSSLVRTLKSTETLSDPVKLYGIATAASQNLTFSNSLRSIDAMVSVASALRNIPLEEVVFVKYPGFADGPDVIPDTDAAETLFAAIDADQKLVLTGGTGGGTTVAEPADPTDPSAPGASTEPSAPTDPSAPVDPSPPTDPSSPVDPSAPVAPGPVVLPPSIQGQDASQQTCTAGQTAGG